MLRKRSRLSRSQDFDRVYRSGRSVANRYLVLYYFQRPEAGPGGSPIASPRVGFSVSKRLGPAVERNRLKRALREAYRLSERRVRADADLVFIARTPLAELLERGGLAGLEGKLLEVLQKASLLDSGEEQASA